MAGPLERVRVVELAGIGTVPYAGMVLAGLGAEVVRVDRADGTPGFAAWHAVLDRGRRSVALDLKQPRGRALLLRLVARSDVLLEGFRPGVAERLGVGPRECLAANPDLVYGRVTGWGRTGPLAHSPGHDINYLALTGLLAAIGRPGAAPTVPLNVVGDFAAGALPLVVGVLAALFARAGAADRAAGPGRGRVVDASIVDGAANLSGMLTAMAAAGEWSGGRGENLLDGGAPFYDVYLCADGRYLAVGALEERFYTAFVRGLGLDPALLPARADRGNWPWLRTLFAEAIGRRGRDAWAEHFAGSEACVTPVLDLDEAAAHPQLLALGTLRGGTRHPYLPVPAPRISGHAPDPPAPAVRPGAHTRAVLAELGVSGAQLDDLLAAGVAAEPTPQESEPCDIFGAPGPLVGAGLGPTKERTS